MPESQRTSSGALSRLLRMSKPRAVALITAISVVASVVMTTLMLWLLRVERSAWASTLLIAALMPLLIASAVAVIMLRMLHELEAARRMVHDMAIRDGLTGLSNRRHFMELAKTEFEKAARHELELSIAMLDADLFKRINDNHGHATGDEVLRALGEVAAKALRESDVLARYGGEEFVVLLPMTGAATAVVVAERIRQAVADMQIGHHDGAGQAMRVTVSIGVSTRTPETTSVGLLLSRADKALYRAKANGRNRVETAE